jgi:hypothetical protein
LGGVTPTTAFDERAVEIEDDTLTMHV